MKRHLLSLDGSVTVVPPNDAAASASPVMDKRGYAARWQFSPRQVDNFLRQGMPHLKIGQRRVRIDVRDADAWMKEKFGTRRRGAALRVVPASPQQPEANGGQL